MYSNCCCSCSFEPEIIRIGQSSQKIYSNNILNFQESTTILNACTKKSENLLNAPRIYIYIYIYMCVCVCVCIYIYIYIYIYFFTSCSIEAYLLCLKYLNILIAFSSLENYFILSSAITPKCPWLIAVASNTFQMLDNAAYKWLEEWKFSLGSRCPKSTADKEG